MADGYDISTYHGWAAYFPLAIFGLVAILTFLTVSFVHPSVALTSYYDYFINFFVMYTKIVFGTGIEKNNENSLAPLI